MKTIEEYRKHFEEKYRSKENANKKFLDFEFFPYLVVYILVGPDQYKNAPPRIYTSFYHALDDGRSFTCCSIGLNGLECDTRNIGYRFSNRSIKIVCNDFYLNKLLNKMEYFYAPSYSALVNSKILKNKKLFYNIIEYFDLNITLSKDIKLLESIVSNINSNSPKKALKYPIEHCKVIIDSKNISFSGNFSYVADLTYKHFPNIEEFKLFFISVYKIYCRLSKDILDKLSKNQIKFICEEYLSIIESNDNDYFYEYMDYVGMRDQLITYNKQYKKMFPFYIHKKDIYMQHIKICKTYRDNFDEIEKLKYKKLNNNYINNFYSKVKSLEYSNNLYSIIACKDLFELNTEGSNLHHCVASYKDKVANGDEIILFLRENKDLDKSYYTINIKNNAIIQILGFGNKHIDSLEVHKFIEEWAKKFNLFSNSYLGKYK